MNKGFGNEIFEKKFYCRNVPLQAISMAAMGYFSPYGFLVE